MRENRWKLTLLILALSFSCTAHSQTSFHTGFEENMEKYYPITQKENAEYVMQLQRPQWIDGIEGRALDLSKNAVLRKPLVLDSIETPLYGKMHELSVKVWVKTIKGAHQGTAIIGNKPDNKFDEVGWVIYTQPNGAWGVNISDGKNAYTYKPNVPRQAINDGEWHQLAFCINREKEEVWYYLDGLNVAIYNTPGLGSVNSKHRTIIGGTDEYFEYGSAGQWTAFNGYLDEISVKNEYENANSVRNSYSLYRTIEKPDELTSPLRTLVWNIWHGGRRYGKNVGVKRVIETIKDAQPDVIGLIETYGSGEIIADSLGYHFYLVSSNLSIMSRFPITETVKAFRPFNFGGAVLNLGNGKECTFLDTWLHYLPGNNFNIINKEISPKELVKAEGKTRHSEIKSILKEIKPILANSNKSPVIMLGDFNTGSHLDWTESAKGIHYEYVVQWPVSIEMKKAGFTDSFRELNIDPLLDPGMTWTPRAATSSKKYGLRDRIDYIYYKGNIKAIESKVIDYHPIMFPSDHAAVITVFEFSK